jgi:CRISPR-associated endonuclease Csn1
MGYKRTVLGLDIGVGSVGWGLVELAEEKYLDRNPDGTSRDRFRICDGKILASGVRTFQLPQDRDGKSLAVKRGVARRNRQRTRRKSQRLKRLIALGREFGLIDDTFTHENVLKPHKGDKEQRWDIWWIRKEALKRKLTDIELFRVLYHIAKHRGFYFHTTAEEIQEEESGTEAGKAKAGLAHIRQKLEKGGWQTVGQMFWEEFNQQNEVGKRKRNTKDNYQNSIHRLLLKDEITVIFQQQKKFKNSNAKPDLLKLYIDEVLMAEEGIDDKKLQGMMNHCEFTGEICAPKEGYAAERFSLFNRLNSLELIDTGNKDKQISLDDNQRQKITALAYEKNKVTFAHIRTELGLKKSLQYRFNLCSYRENNPEYSKKIDCQVKDGQLLFDDKHQIPIVDIRTGEVSILDREIQSVLKSKKRWSNSKKVSVYYSDIRKQLNLSDEYRFKNLSGYTKSIEEFGDEEKYIKQFENKDVFIELRGFHKIRKAILEHTDDMTWQKLQKDRIQLETIAEALTYCKSNDTREIYLKNNGIRDKKVVDSVLTLNMSQVANFSSKAIDRLLEYMEAGDLFHDAKEQCGYHRQEYDKHAILKPYEGFFEKNPVVARVFSQTRKVVNAIIRKYISTYPIDQIHVEVATELANSKKRKIEIASGQKRYREEKEAAIIRCREKGLNPEEGQTLLMFRLAEQQNNRCPYTNTPISFEPTGSSGEVYIMDCEIDHIIPMSRSFNDSLNNKVLCTQKANQNKQNQIPFEWFEKQYGKNSQEWADYEKWVKKLYNMPYSKRINLTRKSWTEKDKERFFSRNLNDTRYASRHFSDYLRKYFDFSGSHREDIKDVSRIQLRSGGVTAFLRHMWGLNKNRDENDLHHALDAIVVACSTFGHVYLVSNLSKEIERKGKSWYKHFGREKFKPWGSIREDIQAAVDNIFVSRMPRHTVTAAAHEETVKSLTDKPKNRVIELNQGYAKLGPMVRADVYIDEAGQNYMVPIYAVDMVNKRALPNKYIYKSDAPYEEWPTVEDNGLSFKYSLFKDDLVEVDGKMYYVSYVKGTRPKMAVKNIDGSSFNDGSQELEFAYRKRCLKKYSIDILGNYKEIEQEKRQGNRFEKKR